MSRAQVTYGQKKGGKIRLLGLFAITLIIISPLIVHAGFFSYFMDLLRGEQAFAEVTTEPNSQTIPLLEAVRNIDPSPPRGGGDIIIVGDSALLPDAGPSGTLANIEEGTGHGQISLYVVREGDSLSQIAKMFNVSVNTIIWSNDIKRGSLITPGQTLVILPITGIQHTVAKGETLASIVKKYKGHMEEVLQYNDLEEGAVLAIGDTVVIPDGEVEIPVYSAAGTVVRGTGGPTYSGYYMRPVTGIKTQGLHGYNAVDIGAPAGTPIVASAAGTVIVSKNSGWNGGYGEYVVVKHNNGTQTLYAHASSVIVSQGQYVQQGQIIAYVGTTGKSTGPHLHFEVRGAKNPF